MSYKISNFVIYTNTKFGPAKIYRSDENWVVVFTNYGPCAGVEIPRNFHNVRKFLMEIDVI